MRNLNSTEYAVTTSYRTFCRRLARIPHADVEARQAAYQDWLAEWSWALMGRDDTRRPRAFPEIRRQRWKHDGRRKARAS